MLSPTLFVLLGVMALLLDGVGGHMIMRMPTPYNLNTEPFLQVNPLDGVNFPYPCQGRAGVDSRTTIKAGEATLVAFTGGAQHGGGSCQFSISYDDPSVGGWNASASFKTVYSIIGGCPAQFTNQGKNLPPTQPDAQGRAETKQCGNDYDVDCTRQFLIPIPSFLKNGPATFAWTWHNKLGNREMYMNCAPINITGGSGDQAAIDNLPDIFVANVPNSPGVSDCVTGGAEPVVLNYPNPGVNGRILDHPLEVDPKPTSYCQNIPAARDLPSFVSDSLTVQNPTETHFVSDSRTVQNPEETHFTHDSIVDTDSVSSAPTAASSSFTATSIETTITLNATGPRVSGSWTLANSNLKISTTEPSVTSEPSNTTDMSSQTGYATVPSGYFSTTGAVNASYSRVISPTPSPSSANTHWVTASVSHAPSNHTLGSGTPSGTPSISTGKVPCPVNGALVCIGENMWGLCDWGTATPQMVAPGTKCENGQIVAQSGFRVRRAN